MAIQSWEIKKLHIAVNKSEEEMNKQKFKYRRMVFGQKTASNNINLVAMEIIINQKKKKKNGIKKEVSISKLK